MKLSELKVGLIEQFFTENSNGVSQDLLDPIFESTGKSLGIDLNPERLTALFQQSNQSSDPNKAFKRFTEGRISILTILEEDGIHKNAIFAAVRSGTSVKVINLTSTPLVEKLGDLAAVKSALRQAKNRNDEIFFNIAISERI